MQYVMSTCALYKFEYMCEIILLYIYEHLCTIFCPLDSTQHSTSSINMLKIINKMFLEKKFHGLWSFDKSCINITNSIICEEANSD